MTSAYSPTYCPLDEIEGLHEERERALALLARHAGSAPAIVLLGLDDPDWVYGQATFVHEEGKPFKFCDRFTTVASNRVLDTLRRSGAPKRILFVDGRLKGRFESHPAFSSVRSLFQLVPEFVPEPSAGLLSRMKDRIKRVFDLTAKSKDERVDPVSVYRRCLTKQENLEERVKSLFALNHYCALDHAQQALEERLAAAPGDADTRVLLAMLLSEFGDHVAAAQLIRAACKAPAPAPEAWAWLAKECWFEGATEEGLAALARLTAVPAWWPDAMNFQLAALRAALLSQKGDQAGAVAAYRDALELSGKSWALQLCLAQELVSLGRTGEARAAVAQAEVLEPDNPLILVERCRLLQADGNSRTLQSVLKKLARTERGRLEARRFDIDPAIEGVGSAIPEAFERIDRYRRETFVSGLLPSWFSLCDDPFVTFLGIAMSPIRDKQHPHTSIAGGLHLLTRQAFMHEIYAAMTGAWALLKRFDLAVQWSRGAIALAPELVDRHYVGALVHKNHGEADEAYEIVHAASLLDIADDDVRLLGAELLWTIPRYDTFALLARHKESRESARSHAQQMLDVTIHRPVALVVLSLIDEAEGNLMEASSRQREALKSRPEDLTLHGLFVRLSRALGQPAQVYEAEQGQAHAVLRLLSRDASAPLTARAVANLAWARLVAGEFEAAALYVRAATTLDAEDCMLMLARGQLQLARGELDSSVADLRRVVFADREKDSQVQLAAAMLLAEALQGAERHEEALEAWRRVQELEPGQANAYLQAGHMLWILDRDLDAAAMVRLSLELEAERAFAWGMLGRIHFYRKEYGEALVPLERAMTFEDRSVHVLRCLVQLLIAEGRADDALRHCEAALAKDAGDTEAIVSVVAALGATGAVEDARARGLAALKHEGLEARDAEWIREFAEEHGGLAVGLCVGEAALPAFPDSVTLLVDHAWLLVRLGRFAEAVAVAEKAVNLQPEHRRALRTLCLAYGYLGEIEAESAQALAERTRQASTSAWSLRLVGDLLRAARLDMTSSYEAALRATDEEADVDQHQAAWCLLHLRRVDEAFERMSRIEKRADGSHSEEVILDRALLGFLASGGDAPSTVAFVEAVRAVAPHEKADGLFAEIRSTIPQWRWHGLFDSMVLDALSATLDGALRESILAGSARSHSPSQVEN
jgi:tetratricopeptide (TPR) repeat protein